MNLGFSSTPGVQIAMSRFNEVEYDAATNTATVGTGLVWDDVYTALAPHAVMVVGGRVPGIGVGGFALGGGAWPLSDARGGVTDCGGRVLMEDEPVRPDGGYSGRVRTGLAGWNNHFSHRGQSPGPLLGS